MSLIAPGGSLDFLTPSFLTSSTDWPRLSAAEVPRREGQGRPGGLLSAAPEGGEGRSVELDLGLGLCGP